MKISDTNAPTVNTHKQMAEQAAVSMRGVIGTYGTALDAIEKGDIDFFAITSQLRKAAIESLTAADAITGWMMSRSAELRENAGEMYEQISMLMNAPVPADR